MIINHGSHVHDISKESSRDTVDYFGKFSKYSKGIYSGHGEEGIIEELLNYIGQEKLNKWCCEFGAWDGKHFSNTFALVEKGWNAVYIESDKKKFDLLLKTANEHSSIIAINKTVHYIKEKGELLDEILSQTIIPYDFDILSIDVDGPDYHIWKSLKNYKPKIVVIEHSGNMEDYIIYRDGAIHKKDGNGSTSFLPMKELGEEKGYSLIVDTGNLIFLDEKFIGK